MTRRVLSVLAVDDEPPALDELVHLLSSQPLVARVVCASNAVQALRLLQEHPLDALFLDISMPGLSGIELGELLAGMAVPPALVYVTAFREHAVSAFAVGAVDYLLKPVRPERLTAALDRVARRRTTEEAARRRPVEQAEADDLAALPVDLNGRTLFVHREDVRYAEAHGDYVRLYTAYGAYQLRLALSTLAARWAGAGFVRVHRAYLVPVRHVRELRDDPLGGLLVRVELSPGTARDLPVSRRHARALKARLQLAARRGELGGGRMSG